MRILSPVKVRTSGGKLVSFKVGDLLSCPGIHESGVFALRLKFCQFCDLFLVHLFSDLIVIWGSSCGAFEPQKFSFGFDSPRGDRPLSFSCFDWLCVHKHVVAEPNLLERWKLWAYTFSWNQAVIDRQHQGVHRHIAVWCLYFHVQRSHIEVFRRAWPTLHQNLLVSVHILQMLDSRSKV